MGKSCSTYVVLLRKSLGHTYIMEICSSLFKKTLFQNPPANVITFLFKVKFKLKKCSVDLLPLITN